MKKMTCKQLGGACDLEFEAASFQEIAQLSQKHGMDMFNQSDAEHHKAMENMNELMKSEDAMQKWVAEKEAEFNALPES